MISNLHFVCKITSKFLIGVFFLVLIFIAFANQIVFAQNDASLIISEFMSDNESALSDEDGEYSDWIEIQNVTPEDINVEGWYLSDDQDNLIKWLFPDYTIPAHGFLIVFASGKDKRVNTFHTNFKLSSSGETLLLTKPDGNTIACSIENYPPQAADVSYSYVDESWSFAEPTPGKTNSTGNFLNPPIFSVAHGFFDQPFTLSMSNISGDSIIYTLDGTTPGLLNGIRYKQPFTSDSTAIIRAIAFRGDNTSQVATTTYIFADKVRNQPFNPEGYPTSWGAFSKISGVAPADYEMDPEICNNPDYSELIIPALRSIPSISIVTNKGYLFSHSTDPDTGGIYIHTDPPTGGLGEDWARPVSVEYLLPEGEQDFQIDCGIRIHGGHSRVPEKNPKHSFRLIFRNEYGAGKLSRDIFGDGATVEFNSIILRAGFNQSWLHWDNDQRNAAQYINDSWAKDTWMQMGHTAAHNKFVHLYINGLYWGLYNISERMDDDFMVDYLGGEQEDWDIIKDYGEVAEGNKDAWNIMMDMAREGLSDAASFYKIQGKNEFGEKDETMEAYLDIPNLIDFMILNFYAGNLDWDHHNWVAARNRVNPDEGFQFFPWDSERIFFKLNSNIVDENNEDRPSFLYSQLRQNPIFRIEFAERANELLGDRGLLSADSVSATWSKRSSEIALAVIAESARWGDYRRDVHTYKDGPYQLYTKFDHWDKEQQWLLNEYFPQRSQIVLDQLREIGLAGDIITGNDNISSDDNTNYQVYPMPFTTQVSINYRINDPGNVEIIIYAPGGKVAYFVKEEHKIPGQKQFSWQPENTLKGIYFYQIRTTDVVYSGKLIYIH